MTVSYIVSQRMGSKWEYRNTFDTAQEAIQFIIDNNSPSYPQRIRQVKAITIFEEHKNESNKYIKSFKKKEEASNNKNSKTNSDTMRKALHKSERRKKHNSG